MPIETEMVTPVDVDTSTQNLSVPLLSDEHNTDVGRTKSSISSLSSPPSDPHSWRPPIVKKGLGTFMGVMVPCMISIIGVILYIRLGWAVGQAGVLVSLGMFAVGGGMALLTDFSLSAMATNGRIGGGGTYYLVSRSVGPQLGGAVGVMFYAANTIGMAFYLQGFTETVATLLGLDEHDPMTYWIRLGVGTSVLLFETIVNIVSSSLYAKMAFIVWAIQMGTIYYGNIALLTRSPFQFSDQSDCVGSDGKVCQFVGPNLQTLRENLFPDWTQGNTLSHVFGIIFPAITGIMAGTNMSGVLKRPELAIPRGELGALAWTMGTYAVLIVSFGASVPRATLHADKYILADVTWFPWAVTFGVLTSTMSSALASMQSSGRLLQAIAKDDLIPFLKFFAKTTHNEPVRAILFSVLLAECFLAIGSLDIIAPILTMFFLITYAVTNFATFIHTISGHPNFRPRFRFFTWHTAIVGFVFCLTLMVYLAWYATIIAMVLGVLVAVYIAKNAPDTDWGEVSQSLIYHQVRKYLLRLDSRKDHVKFWRPQLLYLAHSPSGRVNVMEFINKMKKGGLFVIGDCILSPVDDVQRFRTLDEQRNKWLGFVKEANLKAFINVAHAPTLRHGVSNLMITGLGGMRVNTLALDIYPDNPDFVGSEAHTQALHELEIVGPASPLSPSVPGSGSGSGSFAIGDSDSEASFRYSVFDNGGHGKQRPIRSSVKWPRRISEPQSQSHSQSPSGRVSTDSSVNGAGVSIELDEEESPLHRAEGGDAWNISPAEYVDLILDTFECGHNIMIMCALNQLNYAEIAKCKRPSWANQMAPAPRSVAKFNDSDICAVTVWDVPWGSEDSRKFALQMASMLNDADFWHTHTYLRVCSVIGNDDGALSRVKKRFGTLYQDIVRDSRIRAVIGMYLLSEDAPELLDDTLNTISEIQNRIRIEGEIDGIENGEVVNNENEDNHNHMSQGDTQTRENVDVDVEVAMPSTHSSVIDAEIDIDHDPLAVLGKLDSVAQKRIINKFIRQQSEQSTTAVTFLPVPELPARDGAGSASSTENAKKWIKDMKELADGIGPVVFVYGQQAVVCVDL